MFTTQNSTRLSLILASVVVGSIAEQFFFNPGKALAIDPNACRVCSAPVDWTTLPSTYTHDQNGRRVDQYALAFEPQSNERPDFQTAGFRHTRSTLQAGTSADNYHLVERWGPPVQPYGEWRYPYRPFSVPYGAWGPQSPLVNVQGASGGWRGGLPWIYGNIQPAAGQNGFAPILPPTGSGQGGFEAGYPQWWNGFGVGPGNALRPDQDDYYPAAPEAPPVSDRDFFYVPMNP
jgi:hypothetical protein